MHPFMTEMLARDHRRTLLAEAAGHQLRRDAQARRPPRIAGRDGRGLRLGWGWRRARRPQLQPCPRAR